VACLSRRQLHVTRGPRVLLAPGCQVPPWYRTPLTPFAQRVSTGQPVVGSERACRRVLRQAVPRAAEPTGAPLRPRSMRLCHAVASGCILAVVMATGACGSRSAGGDQRPAADATFPASAATQACGSGSGFALSLVSDRGGQPTPVRAAQWLAQHGAVPGIPHAGWREISRHDGNALVASGPVTLHVIQGPDRTWQVDSGERCAGQHS
jgi:hypothetical protein